MRNYLNNMEIFSYSKKHSSHKSNGIKNKLNIRVKWKVIFKMLSNYFLKCQIIIKAIWNWRIKTQEAKIILINFRHRMDLVRIYLIRVYT
jgi:hypothetical protein